MAYFLVTLVRGPTWDEAQPRRSQQGWDEHAAFMDGLHRDGTIVLGGPLGTDLDSGPALMLVEADDEAQAAAAFVGDPWHEGVLRTATVEPWALWLPPVGPPSDG